ncbi:hypothetical protein SALBM311S_11994 [Streptomyces alboniger]
MRALESTGRSPAPRHHWFRSTGSVLLILLAALLSLLAVVAVLGEQHRADTDRYVATVGPLASNPDVQKAVTARVTTAVLAQVDVEALVKELEKAAAQKGAPPKVAALLGDLKGPITSGLKSLVSGTVERVVSSKASTGSPPADVPGPNGLEFARDRFAMNIHGDVDSHLDALCHVVYDGTLHGGVPAADALSPDGASALSVDLARDGIAGRGSSSTSRGCTASPGSNPESM